MRKQKPVFLPGPNEILFDYHKARALRAFTSSSEYRGELQSVLVTPEECVATDGHALIQIPHEEKNANFTTEKSRMVHRDALLLVRRSGERLSLNLESGKLKILGEGPVFPITLRKAPDGERFPSWKEVVDAGQALEKVAALAINPALLQKAMAVVGKTGHGIILEIPENSGPYEGDTVPHVQTGIPFRIINGEATGLIMPMRIIE